MVKIHHRKFIWILFIHNSRNLVFEQFAYRFETTLDSGNRIREKNIRINFYVDWLRVHEDESVCLVILRGKNFESRLIVLRHNNIFHFLSDSRYYICPCFHEWLVVSYWDISKLGWCSMNKFQLVYTWKMKRLAYVRQLAGKQYLRPLDL